MSQTKTAELLDTLTLVTGWKSNHKATDLVLASGSVNVRLELATWRAVDVQLVQYSLDFGQL